MLNHSRYKIVKVYTNEYNRTKTLSFPGYGFSSMSQSTALGKCDFLNRTNLDGDVRYRVEQMASDY